MRTKSGGRAKGTPNKPKPAREVVRAHSMDYFLPKVGETRSQFEKDLEMLTPSERVQAEIKLLRYHVPELKAVDIDASVTHQITIEDRLRELAGKDY